MNRKNAVAPAIVGFALASALPITIWPLAGLAIASSRSVADLDFSQVGIVVPLIFGLYNAVTVAIGFRRTRLAMLLAGAFLGLVMASIGLALSVPQRAYGLSGQTQWLVLLGAPVFYGLVWGFALRPVERLVQRHIGRINLE